MNGIFSQSLFSKATLTGVFVGFCTTIICLIFNIIYRDSTGFVPQDFINVSSLIFAINLLFLIVGMLYSVFLSFKKGDTIFMIAFALLTIFCIWRTMAGHRFANSHLNTEFKDLLLGMLIIVGIAASFVIPYLYHNKNFERNVL